ncbi:general substrate transporter [Backusella circina FSU 941]|nr:general substrate transporter [Backusella circina FSU 941]
MSKQKEITSYLVFVVCSILLGTFQFGYHNGELNTPQQVISKCKDKHEIAPLSAEGTLPICIPMLDSQYALVVSMLTGGGLIGALMAAYFNDHFGRRRTLFSTNVVLCVGSLLLTLASSPAGMMIGRFITGIGIGLVTVIVPTYISECVPESNRGFFGTLAQLATVVGILVAQVIGLSWSTLAKWRLILGMGIVLSVFQMCLLPFCVDSPRYLASLPGGFNRAKEALLRLRGSSILEVEEEINEWRRNWANDSIATNDIETSDDHTFEMVMVEPVEARTTVSMLKFLTSPSFRKPLFLVFLLQFTQQASGINAVIFFSTSIMSSIFPDSSDMITVYISIVNLIMTVLSAYLMDRLGRRFLFLISSVSMAFMAFTLGFSIENGHNTLSVCAIIGYVAAFAIGLGPIPFLMMPELVATPSVSSAAATGLSINMISNFLVSAGFLSVRNVLGEGKVFYLFGLLLVLLSVVSYIALPETKNRNTDEIIRSGYALHPQPYQSLSKS